MSLKDYIVAIPSYKRTEELKEKTLAMLERFKIPPSKINIFVEKNQISEYKKALGNKYKIIEGGKGLVGQLRKIYKYYPENKWIVRIDDDIVDIRKMKYQRFEYAIGKITRAQLSENVKNFNLDKFIKFAFNLCEKNNIRYWGINSKSNNFNAGSGYTIGLKVIAGGFNATINTHNPKYDWKVASPDNGIGEDIERTIIFFKNDGGVLRFNNVNLITDPEPVQTGMTESEGGIIKRMNKTKTNFNKIEKLYPEAVSSNDYSKKNINILSENKAKELYRTYKLTLKSVVNKKGLTGYGKFKISTRLFKSPIDGKKYRAVFYRNGEEFKYTDFGAEGMSDYTIHKDKERKERYLNRHKKNEDWEDPFTAGALSRWVLWEKPSLKSSWNFYKKMFNFK